MGNGAVHIMGNETERIYSEKLFCVPCGLGYEELDPRMFSFNSRQGACPECAGQGFRWEFDPQLLVPNPHKSLKEDALLPLTESGFKRDYARLLRGLKKHRVPVDKPFSELTEKQHQLVFHGNDTGVRGVLDILNDALTDGDGEGKDAVFSLSQFLSEVPCPMCDGARLTARARRAR